MLVVLDKNDNVVGVISEELYGLITSVLVEQEMYVEDADEFDDGIDESEDIYD